MHSYIAYTISLSLLSLARARSLSLLRGFSVSRSLIFPSVSVSVSLLSHALSRALSLSLSLSRARALSLSVSRTMCCSYPLTHGVARVSSARCFCLHVSLRHCACVSSYRCSCSPFLATPSLVVVGTPSLVTLVASWRGVVSVWPLQAALRASTKVSSHIYADLIRELCPVQASRSILCLRLRSSSYGTSVPAGLRASHPRQSFL